MSNRKTTPWRIMCVGRRYRGIEVWIDEMYQAPLRFLRFAVVIDGEEVGRTDTLAAAKRVATRTVDRWVADARAGRERGRVER